MYLLAVGWIFKTGVKLFMALLSKYVEICVLHAIIIELEYYTYLWKELALCD